MRVDRIVEDLRQPLSCAYGYAEMLLTRDFNADTQRDVHAALVMQLEVMRDIMERYVPTEEGRTP